MFLVVFGAAVCLSAQSQTPTADSSYPEKSYLSPDRYTNEYFDFTFDIPIDVHLRPMSLPASRSGNILLLELVGPAPADAEISVVAIPTASDNKQDAKTYLREQLDQELYRGVEELHSLSKASFSQHQFFLYETRRGIEQHMFMTTMIGDYIVEFMVSSHDEKTVKKLETAVQHLEFFPPADLRQHVEANSKSYEGPAISTHQLALLAANPPAKQIDPGKINGDFYENSMLGFSYRIPQGWVLKQEGIVQPAVERYRAREDYGRPRIGRSERVLLDACSKTLFSAWAKRPAADGEISYDDFGEVTVSAIALSCFPNMKFPKQDTDVQTSKDFVGQFALTHPIVEDMGSGKVFSQDGITFVYLHGTVAFQIPNDELSRRLSLAMAITERRGYLLTWFFAAPHDAELEGLTNERAIFDNQPSVNVASKAESNNKPDVAGDPATPTPSSATAGGETGATNPASAGAATSTAGSSPANSPAGSDAARSAPTPGSAPAASANTADSSAASDAQSAPASSDSDRPSLLRPGETMQTQQGKGAVIKSK